MSIQITVARVQEYKGNVVHLAQQKESRLRRAVRVEPVFGKRSFFDQIGQASVHWKTSRHQPTPRTDTPHARRSLITRTAQYSDLIDSDDKLKLVWEPEGQYVKAGGMTFGRAMDDVIIEAVDAIAYTGEEGTTQVNFDTNMIVDVQVREVGVTAADYGLNVAKLIEAGKLLDLYDNDPDEERFIGVNAAQISSLLKTTKATSSDYNSVKALVEGKINSLMGFTFIKTQRLLVDGNDDHKVPFWTKNAMLLGVAAEPKTDIGPRRDMSNATQVYMEMEIGATRMEETGVGYIECDPAGVPGA
jgi:hypothetical protein